MVLLSAAVKGVPDRHPRGGARSTVPTSWQIFVEVVVPQIKGTIITVFVTVLIGVMKIFDIVYVMTNGDFNTNVVGDEFYNQLSARTSTTGTASAIVVHADDRGHPVMVYQVRHFQAEEANR